MIAPIQPARFLVGLRSLLAVLLSLAFTGCHTPPPPGAPVARTGDEIVVCGQLFHTGTPVVTWMDPGGYDAYRVERRFSPVEESDWTHSTTNNKSLTSPNRYDLRKRALTPEQIEQYRGGGWDLPALQQVVDQFVVHFDVSGTSRQCFKVLHDQRCLSVHFMLDLDGTIYQTLDLKERAWHATTSNTRSVGVEIANIGAYPPGQNSALEQWYRHDTNGRPYLQVPAALLPTGFRRTNFVPRPARPQPVSGVIQNHELVQYDFTPEQYAALTKLVATLCRVFPKLTCDYPHDAAGQLIPHKLPDEVLTNYHGLLGHYHIQTNKVDPGPAFQWERVVEGARPLLR